MADGRIRRHGRNRHSYEQRDGGWWDRGNPVSHENLLRYFSKDQLLQNERGKWDFNRAREDSLTDKQKDERFNYEMDYDKFPYDRKGNRFVRDPNVPLTQFEKTEKSLEGMMGGMKSGMGGRRNLFNELDSNDDFFGGKGFWQPPKDNPYIPSYNEVQKSGQMYRGPDFARENYASPFGQGASWNSPIKSMSPSIGDSFRNMEQYRMPSSNSLTPLSPSGIDNFNKQNWLQPAPDWNSGMKNWR